MSHIYTNVENIKTQQTIAEHGIFSDTDETIRHVLHTTKFPKPVGIFPLSKLIETLADAEHASWSRWMQYLFSKSTHNRDGSVTIPQELADRWKWLAETDYADLTRKEQESDREEVRKIIPLIEDHYIHVVVVE